MIPPNPYLEQLHDIEGLDPISIWPLASGWWILISSGVVLSVLLIYLLIRWVAYKKSWRCDTKQKLDLLEKNLSETNIHDTVIALSEYLRRIVLKKHPRQECAALFGEEWLQWLTKNDPKKFDWIAKGQVIITMPYARGLEDLGDKNMSSSSPPLPLIRDLIKSTRNWVK